MHEYTGYTNIWMIKEYDRKITFIICISNDWDLPLSNKR